MAGEYQTLALEREGPILWLTLNRPAALNSMNLRMIDELHDCLDGLGEDRETRVVVMRGAGRHFCAGLDLKENRSEQTNTIPKYLRFQRSISWLIVKMRRLPQPFVACVQGAASGGGFALVLAADVRIAGESARMNAAFIRIGLSACDIGCSYMLPRLVGLSLASELLLTGKFIDAKRSLSSGLVSQVVPDDQLQDAGRQMAQEIVANAPLAVVLTKEALNYNVDAGSLEAAIAMEDRQQILTASTQDCAEAVRGFFEKRTPQFKNR
ncbi:MAG: enoyl-CoA hydratase/isomerase family protein [Dehalococcoidia bacterium]|nr:enoyl-CoA hydratase/isomerase family protein [Dehalococcoidia bacterium]